MRRGCFLYPAVRYPVPAYPKPCFKAGNPGAAAVERNARQRVLKMRSKVPKC